MKIARVIDSCHDCHHLLKTKDLNSNYIYAAICSYPNEEEFLIATGNESHLRNPIAIPKNCPLESYKGTRPIIEKGED